MAKKVHIICAKCGSDDVTFVVNKTDPDDPLAVASIRCRNCCELTSIDEWCEHNGTDIEY